MKFTFELKVGTSLSKGFQIINRFSEDIDIRIEPPLEHDVKVKPNQLSQAQIKTRTDFYDWLAKTISINGIKTVERDAAADDIPYYRTLGSGGGTTASPKRWSGPKTQAIYDDASEASSSLYYKDKPTFEQMIAEIGKWVSKL